MTRRIDKKQGNVRGFPALLNTSELWSYHWFPTRGITIFTVPQTDNPTTQIDGLTNYSEYLKWKNLLMNR